MSSLLQPLPYAQWEPTKTTLHLWSQIVGKIALGCVPDLNHWWAVRLRPTARGFSTHLLRFEDSFFQLRFDFVDHKLVLESNHLHDPLSFGLHDGLTVSEFYSQTLGLLANAGIHVPILAKPYGVPMTTPFADDREHGAYDAQMVRRFWLVSLWSSNVMETFASRFCGKQSEPELFWHSFDIAMGRYSGAHAPNPPAGDDVAREAYCREVIAFGFWAGDANVPDPTYYTYTAPEPGDLTEQPLTPRGARWVRSGQGHLGTLPYESVRTSTDPAATLLSFLESGYQAGVRSAKWNAEQYTR